MHKYTCSDLGDIRSEDWNTSATAGDSTVLTELHRFILKGFMETNPTEPNSKKCGMLGSQTFFGLNHCLTSLTVITTHFCCNLEMSTESLRQYQLGAHLCHAALQPCHLYLVRANGPSESHLQTYKRTDTSNFKPGFLFQFGLFVLFLPLPIMHQRQQYNCIGRLHFYTKQTGFTSN